MITSAAHTSACSRNETIISMSAPAFEKESKSGSVQLLDVRTSQEFAEGHIDGAVNINVQSADFKKLAETELSKDSTVLVYCRSGRRSLDAAEILTGLGYKVVNLKGGIIEWKECGLPVKGFSVNGIYENGNDKSTLTISKEKNGKYTVTIDLFRLTQIYSDEGILSGNVLKFSSSDAAGSPLYGEILVNGDSAKLIITRSTWEYLPKGTSFIFERK